MTPDPQPTLPPADWAIARNLRLARRLDGLRVDTAHGRGLIREGVLRRAVGLTLEAVGCEAPLGASCKVEVVDGGWVDAEVVGFAGERTYLMPSAELHVIRDAAHNVMHDQTAKFNRVLANFCEA